MRKKIAYILLSSALALGIGGQALASNPFGPALKNLQPVQEKTELPDNLSDTIGTVVKALLSLVGTIFLLLTIYAGIMWMTAQGNEERVGKAKEILQAAAIGLVITMGAYAITVFVTSKLGNVAVEEGPEQTGCCIYATSQCADNTQTACTDLNGNWSAGMSCGAGNTCENL